MRSVISGFFWVSLYLVAVLAPVLLMLVPPVPTGRGFWVELSVALGFVGLTQIGIQFVLIARFKQITAPYGLDVILQYHRKIAVVAVILILLHPVVLLLEHPSRIMLFNPFSGTYASRFGLLAVVALIAIVVTSLWRERLRLNYERWRVAHAVLGVAALVFAQAHISMAGLYINTPWKQAFWICSSVLLVSLLGYLRFVKPALQRRRPWRVVSVEDVGADTHALTIEPVGHEGFSFEPGQFAWIKVSESPYSIDEHPFSFASSADRPGNLSFGIKALGDFSSSVPEMEKGATVFVDGPHGAFSIDRFQAPGFVFIAGGIGITPFIGFLRTMADRRDPRPVTLIFGAPTEDDLAYREELKALAEKVDLETVFVLEDPPEDWPHEEGVVTKDLLERRLPRERYQLRFFVCGPPVMIDAVEKALIRHDIPRDHIHTERFALA